MKLAPLLAIVIILIVLSGQAQVPHPPEVSGLKVVSAPASLFPFHFERNKVVVVMVKLTVNEDGGVDAAEYVSGDVDLAGAATKVALRWKFKPFLRDGKAIRVATKLPVKFVPSRLRVDDESLRTRQIRMIDPVYPSLAQSAKIEGVVVLQAIIGKDGKVLNIRAVSGHQMLVPAAVDAVKQWKYKPYRLDGIAVEVESQIRVEFSLAN
jgi:TonB family protein